MPFAFLMGVDWADCQAVGKFLGIKTFLNELVAYVEMEPYVTNRKENNGGPTISVRIEQVWIIPAWNASDFSEGSSKHFRKWSVSSWTTSEDKEGFRPGGGSEDSSKFSVGMS